jgi:hypothetical protein
LDKYINEISGCAKKPKSQDLIVFLKKPPFSKGEGIVAPFRQIMIPN